MNWKVKAALQNGVAVLPSRASYAAYYAMQRLFGGLANPDSAEPLNAAVQTWERIVAQGIDPRDKTFFEVGTGRAPVVPLAYWLMGARRTITVDLNPYLKRAVMIAALDYIVGNVQEMTKLFGRFLQRHRFEALLRWYNPRTFSLRECLSMCAIEYRSPADAANTGLPAGSVDFHTSYTVFEHIPGDTLRNILHEGNRIIRDAGLFVHMIDYSDHFSHSDPTISPINFLQYSDAQWAHYGDNRYMYMNRLRHDDMVQLFEQAGHRFVGVTVDVDEGVKRLLAEGGLCLDSRFAAKSPEVLSIRGAWIVSEKSTTRQAATAS
jgi:hypothetical protein